MFPIVVFIYPGDYKAFAYEDQSEERTQAIRVMEEASFCVTAPALYDALTARDMRRSSTALNGANPVQIGSKHTMLYFTFFMCNAHSHCECDPNCRTRNLRGLLQGRLETRFDSRCCIHESFLGNAWVSPDIGFDMVIHNKRKSEMYPSPATPYPPPNLATSETRTLWYYNDPLVDVIAAQPGTTNELPDP